MPSIASHFVVAKLVSKRIGINSDEFYKGNILPDIIDDSHFKIRGTYYEIPDIDKYLESVELNDLEIGYLTHLLLDKYFLEEYIPNNIDSYQEKKMFLSGKMYNDYSKINYELVKKFNLDVSYINKIMMDIDNVNEKKLSNNLKSINNKEVLSSLECLDINKFILFLEDVSIKISNYIKEKI